MRVVEVPYSDPLNVFTSLMAYGYPVRLFLDSAQVNPKTGRYSFITIGVAEEISLKDDPLCFEKLRNFWLSLSKKYKVEHLPFGIFGFISYDANRFVEEIESKQQDFFGLPDVSFFLPEITLIFDNLEKKLFVVSLSEVNLGSGHYFPKGFRAVLSGFNMDKEYFVWAVNKIKEYIAAGDTFQVNFSQRIDVTFSGDAVELYLKLREINPSPFSFYLDFDEFKVVSCSPERLFKRSGNVVETRPIAGTRRRGKTREEDELLERELFLSEKERAEHIMLVDLERNDLGRVCEFGSVEVNELMVKEVYSHVIHIVSNVRGILREGLDSIDVLKAMFPGGTITGAPKVRTMEIIAELEPTVRGLYTGSVGYIGFNDTADFNIVIRTLLLKEDKGYLQVGAGIVWDSIPEKEYEETLHKGRALLQSLGIEV